MSVTDVPREREPESAVAYDYQGYICYSHHDTRWAAWLQTAIENYAVPRRLREEKTGRRVTLKRCRPIFRDRTEANADPNLEGLLHEALDRSKYLIVLCSPACAQSIWCGDEIRHFRQTTDDKRVLCLIVDGDPNETSEAMRAYPPALLEPLAGHEAPPVPLAADVRPGNDSRREAKLKLIAAILGVRFADLARRDRRRRLREIATRALAALAFIVLCCAIYYLALLAGQHVPGYKSAMRVLNERHWLLPAPVYSADDVADAETRLRATTVNTLLHDGAATGWRWHALTEPTARSTVDAWTIGQALSGLLASSTVDAPERRTLISQALFVPMRPGHTVVRNGINYGWHGVDERLILDDTWPEEALWYICALSRALTNASDLTPAQRNQARSALVFAQRSTDPYRDPRMGGWDGIADQVDKSSISTYTTATALQALLDTRRAGLVWDGSTKLRDALIAATAARLVETMHPIELPGTTSTGAYGWQASQGDENAFEEGVTLQSLTVLLRAEAETGFVLPARVTQSIPPQLAQIGVATYSGVEGTVSSAHFVEAVRGTPGTHPIGTRYIDFAWYPWAIAVSELWLARSQGRSDANSENAARRALGHLVVDLGPEAQADALSHDWAAAELLVNLNLIPPTAPALRSLGFK